jgi:hypothetical protein
MNKLRLSTDKNKENSYYIEPANENIFFEDRQAYLYVKGKKAGVIISLNKF